MNSAPPLTKLRNWASILDEQTRAQAELSATMPFIQPWLALMPDAHLGLGATVGSVIPTVGCIMPAAVGVDIGCGMIAVETQLLGADFKSLDLTALRHQIERDIPLSAGRYNWEISATAHARIRELAVRAPRSYTQTEGRTPWDYQLGTLGSGNHFIEVTADERDAVWLFLHSGSRGIGNRIANEHVKVAQARVKSGEISAPHIDLAWLDEGTSEFNAYIADLEWAQHFALLNREEMMDRVIAAVERSVGVMVEERSRINCHHNFTELLTGDDFESWRYVTGVRAEVLHTSKPQHVWLSRKGAIAAHTGEPGLVPGSMGTASYVVTGLGNPESFNSSPHGAGRMGSRAWARKTFTREDLRRSMEGIEYRDTDAFLDEHPLAYKDIDVVMEDAHDLVQIEHTLHQLLNVKGD